VQPTPTLARRLARPLVLAAGCAVLAFSGAPALAGSGGTGSTTDDGGGGAKCSSQGGAKLRDGRAIPPCNAPRRVVKVIRAANEIAKGKGYCYGGGHASFRDNCYDCSGAVSYALHGGNFVKRPMPSSGYFRWGRGGKGDHFTVYTSSGHMYLMIAGLRFDTSMTSGRGPGWSANKRSSSGFRARHRRNY
jgi:hypothetical protein